MTPAQRILYASSAIHQAAQAGLYFTASNPTPGTGLATIATLATLADTSPFIQINGAAAGAGAPTAWLDYLRLQCTAPGTAGAAIRFAVQHYAAAKAAPTGGSQLTLNSTRSDVAASSAVSVWAGPLVAAAGTPKLVTSQLIRPVIPVVGDMYLIKFGAPDYNIAAQVEAGTAIFDDYVASPPVMVAPGTTSQLHIWLPSQTGAGSWELELGLYLVVD